jgi:integrase
MPLTDVKIRQTKPGARAIKLTDSGGLYIEIKPNGSRLWRYRYEIAGRENVFAIGGYPELSLSDARADRDAARALVKQGIHPSHERARTRDRQLVANKETFEANAREWIEAHRARWSAYYCSQIESYFRRDVYPQIGRRPIRSITAADILGILEAVAGRGAETAAINIRQWISSVFRYAVAKLRADSDPAAALRGSIIRPPVQHAHALGRDGIGLFLRRLRKYGGNRTTALALRMLLLTFVRTVELRKAEWSQFDFDARRWRIPAGILKRRRPHIVPLSSQMITLLDELRTITGSSRWLFPNTRRPTDIMSATTVNRALEYMGYETAEVTGHDFRATASTELHEMGFKHEAIELQLAHAKKDETEAAYNHAQHLPDRIKIMQWWGDLISEIEGTLDDAAG